MTYISQQTGKDPKGNNVSIPVSGPVFKSTTPIAANKSVTTDWFRVTGFTALGFVFNSDQPGYYTIEYSENGTDVVLPMITVQYPASDVNTRRKGAIDMDAQLCRITYYNGPTAQTKFYMSVVLKTTLFQPSLETLNGKGAPSRLAQWSKSQLHLTDGNDNWDDVYRVNNALLVHVDNPTAATDTTLLSTSANQTNGKQTVQIVDGNNQNFGTVARPLNVNVTNPTPATETGLNKETTQQAVLAKLNGTLQVSGIFFQQTQPVSATSLPLPSGASTSTLQTAGNTSLANIDTDLGAPTDAAALPGASSASVIAALKGILAQVGQTASAAQKPATANPFSATINASTPTLILAANTNRKGVSIRANSTSTVGYTTSLTATSGVPVNTNGYFEVPFGYTGPIYAIGTAGTITGFEFV